MINGCGTIRNGYISNKIRPQIVREPISKGCHIHHNIMFIGVSLSLSAWSSWESGFISSRGENNSIFTPQISSFFLCLRKNRNQVVTMEYIKMCLCDKATMQEAREANANQLSILVLIYIGGMCPVFRERDKCRVIERHTTARLLFFLLQKSYRRFIKKKYKKNRSFWLLGGVF